MAGHFEEVLVIPENVEIIRQMLSRPMRVRRWERIRIGFRDMERKMRAILAQLLGQRS